MKIRDEENSSEVNWLESQHEVILKKESVMTLKKMLERLTVHEKEMTAIKERRTREAKAKAKVRYKNMKSSESNTEDDFKRDEDDEFLIENYEDKDDEDNEKDERTYPGVQVGIDLPFIILW